MRAKAAEEDLAPLGLEELDWAMGAPLASKAKGAGHLGPNDVARALKIAGDWLFKLRWRSLGRGSARRRDVP